MASTSASTVPPPAPLKLGGDIAADWERFKCEWDNYEVASDLADAQAKKRAAVFLACIGTAAYGIFRTFKFADEGDKAKIDKIKEAFEKHCIGEANETYERFLFHQRVQQPGESFDDFFTDLRKLAVTCQFAALEDSLIRDRIVVGIRDDPTRRRLLQSKKLSLAEAVEACKASEATSRRLRVIGGSSTDVVDALSSSSSSFRRRRLSSKARDRQPKGNSNNAARCCRYCGSSSCAGKQSCPAYGQRCRNCSKLNHYASVCKSSAVATGSNRKNREVCQVDAEELLALHNSDNKRIYCTLNVDGRSVKFLKKGGCDGT